jgi:hypothetical protein
MGYRNSATWAEDFVRRKTTLRRLNAKPMRPDRFMLRLLEKASLDYRRAF